MESYGLDMEDIFDTAADLDDDLAVPPPIPDLEEGLEPLNEAGEDGEGEDGTDADVLSKLKDLSKGAAKKRVIRPQPKLDLDRLKSSRGLRALPKIFEAVKFKGKGHEAEDLGLLMGKLEHWAHRLFPKEPFGGFVERMEKLGAKKPIQTCIKRIRLDMDDYGDDVLRNGEEEQQEDTTVRGAEDAGAGAAAVEFNDMDAEEAYEEMLREEREMAEKRKEKRGDSRLSATACSFKEGGDDRSVGDKMPGHTPDHRGWDSPTHKATKTPSASQEAKSLTEEQIARMERNRQLAIDRRLAKFGKSPAQQSQSSQLAGSCQKEASSQSEEGSAEPALPSKETTGDQGTVDELEAMLDDKDDDQKTESMELNLHLTETEPSESDMDMEKRDTVQDSRTQGQTEPGLTTTKTSEGTEKGTDDVSEGLHIRMTVSETQHESTEKDMESDGLGLRMTVTQSKTVTDIAKDANHNMEKLDLRLSESEAVCDERSESLGLKLSETETADCDTDSSTPRRKEPGSAERMLRLTLSVSEDESGEDV